MNRQDTATWVVVAIMIAVGFFGLVLTRQVLAPVDDLITDQACSTHGDQLQRPVVAYERSNRFGLINRTYGSCVFGPVEIEELPEGVEAPEPDESDGPILGADADPEVQLVLGLDEIQPGPLYRTLKIMGVVLQLGAASVAVRLLGEPLLDRFIRSRR